MRVRRLIIGVLGIMCAMPAVAREAGGEARRRPNVLFIAVDDLRTSVGCYGDTVAVTPNIDRLARRGMVFTRAYAQQAVCNPSRASLMTGRRPDTTKVWDLETHFRKALPDVVTLPQYFKQHGYHTQSIGKIYHDPEWAQDAASWSAPETLAITKRAGKYALDESVPDKSAAKGNATERADVADDAYIDGQVADAAVRILGEVKDKPFFLAVGFRRPHLPFSAPEKYWDLYDREALPLPEFTTAPANAPKIALQGWAELRGYADMPKKGPLTEEQARTLIHGYYAATSYMDSQLGRVLDELDELGLTTNTIVVLWSDHGYHLGEKGLWCKATNFELDTRVPLIFADPQRKVKGTSTTALAELLDVYPTLVEAAKLPEPEGLEGKSLCPVLENPEAAVRKYAYSQFPRPFHPKREPEVMGYSVRTFDRRYTEWRKIDGGEVVAQELYDHRSDPGEMRNLADNPKYKDGLMRYQGILRGGFTLPGSDNLTTGPEQIHGLPQN